jgi:hypothetical protein
MFPMRSFVAPGPPRPGQVPLPLLLLLFAAPRSATAQSGGPYDLSWHVIDSGGGTAAGGALSLFASAGQPVAGSASGGSYTLIGGFEVPRSAGPTSIHDVPLPGAPLPLAIHRALPNPTTGPSTIVYDLPVVGRLALGVYDVGGRLVRRLESAPAAPGRHAFAWDGRDREGSPVATGLYFLRLDTDLGEHTEKLVVLR